jgi:hypothetical protein
MAAFTEMYISAHAEERFAQELNFRGFLPQQVKGQPECCLSSNTWKLGQFIDRLLQYF